MGYICVVMGLHLTCKPRFPPRRSLLVLSTLTFFFVFSCRVVVVVVQYVPCDVSTVCFGTAASMGAFLLGAGAKVRDNPARRVLSRFLGEDVVVESTIGLS